MDIKSNQLLKTALEQSYNAVVITGPLEGGTLIEYANPAFCRMTGYALDELVGRSPRLLHGPETDLQVIANLRKCLAQGNFFEGSTINYRKDKTLYWVQWNISPVRDETGLVVNFVSIQKDITKQRQEEHERKLLARALDRAGEPIMIADYRGTILFVNRAFESVTGFSAGDLRGRSQTMFADELHAPNFQVEVAAAMAQADEFRGRTVIRRQDGSLRYMELTYSRMMEPDESKPSYVCVAKDITDQVRLEETLLEAANQDPLTGLLSRRAGAVALTNHYQQACATNASMYLVIADIDHFKQVNDQHGHPVGDQVLAGVAKVLRTQVRTNDIVARWGGEEFLIILLNCSLGSAQGLAERIRAGVSCFELAPVGGLTISLGLAEMKPGESLSKLIERADRALYEAKNAGRNRVRIAA
ncbi:MAG: diguanylate cyclase, partial [Lacisediminimonas sp.]|nr:diguanylate cyclase [Lacisediminimonas sp.]